MIGPYLSVALGGALLAIGRYLEHYQDRKFQQAHDRMAELYENGEYQRGAAVWTEYNDDRLVTIALDLFLPCYLIGMVLFMWGLLRLV